MSFVNQINAYSRTIPEKAPPIVVGHPLYGKLGECSARGFVPERGRWASVNAIMRDASRNAIRALQYLEAIAPSELMRMAKARLRCDETILPDLLAGIGKLRHALAVSNYDGMVTARGSYTTAQDIWMQLTATIGGVTLSWYDTMALAWTPGSVPSITAYTNGGTGGAVMTTANNGSWLVNPGGTNKKYLASPGISTPNITGLTLAILYDCLWAGSYSLTTNATINPTTDVAVTRWAGAYAIGNMMMCALTATLTHTGAGTITTSYTNSGGTTGQSTASICPATGPLIHRILFNTLHGSATVVACSPFMPLTNGGNSGVRNLEQVVVSGGTMTSGAVNHKIVRPLQIMPFIAANSFIEVDTTLNIGNMTELVNASQVVGCLGWAVFTAGTTATTMAAFLRTLEG